MNIVVSSAPDDILIDFQEGLKNKQFIKVLTDKQRAIFEATFFVSLCGLVGVFGIAANVINIIIFYKQGFNNTVNIAFFGLAISDLCYLLFLEWASICMNPLLQVYGVPWHNIEVMYVSSAWAIVCFCRITSNITVYITAERWLSIAFPLKIKEIVTKTKTIVIICMIYFVNLMTVVPEWVTCILGWRFVPERNMTLIAVIFTSSRKSVEGISFVIHSLISMTSFSGVVFFTVCLVIKLRQSSQLRQKITSVDVSMSGRDKKAVRMIVLIASILIACYIPGATIALAAFIVGSEFNIQGIYINVCTSVWSIASFFQSINSSVNILLYYKMSSNCKRTIDELFKIYKR